MPDQVVAHLQAPCGCNAQKVRAIAEVDTLVPGISKEPVRVSIGDGPGKLYKSTEMSSQPIQQTHPATPSVTCVSSGQCFCSPVFRLQKVQHCWAYYLLRTMVLTHCHSFISGHIGWEAPHHCNPETPNANLHCAWLQEAEVSSPLLTQNCAASFQMPRDEQK